MINTSELIQNTEEWRLARCGSLGASRVHEAVARTKSGYGASRANLMAELIAERLTGAPAEKYSTAAMTWGTETEPLARDAYCFRTDADVAQVGLIRHPTIIGTHASPDGLIGDDGLLEIKCPTTSTHIDTLLGEHPADRYVKQAHWQMECTGRIWVDLVSFDPRLPEAMRLHITRIKLNHALIDSLRHEIRHFIAELDKKVNALRSRYGAPPVDIGFGVDQVGNAVHPTMAG